MKASVLAGPCIPHPTTPIVIRPEGAVDPSAPSALAGIRVGAAIANPVAARKRRRLMPLFGGTIFIWVGRQIPRGHSSKKSVIPVETFENDLADWPNHVICLCWMAVMESKSHMTGEEFKKWGYA